MFSIIAFISLSCSLLIPPASLKPETPDDKTISTRQVRTPAPQAALPDQNILPRSLYYLSNVGSRNYQVWRVEQNGVTQHQITNEPDSVTEFTVSPVDGRVVYIANNDLVVIDAEGKGRSILVDGAAVNEAENSYHYQTKISGLAWSPDGTRLAFGQNGIQLYDFFSQSTQTLNTNIVATLEDGGLSPVELFFPHSWSPDSSHLLVNVSYLESGSLSVLDILTGLLTPFKGGTACCHPAWANDGQSVFVASSQLGLVSSGLWQYDLQDGGKTTLINEQSKNQTYNFVAHPFHHPNGDLYFFFGSTVVLPENVVPLNITRASSDELDKPVSLRPENFNIFEALWAPLGESLVAVQYPLGEPSWPLAGPIILIDSNGAPVIPLSSNGYQIQWGP
ncbi:MAG: DPP IV N-terminal domain-containing protein [Chloroflexota bacterium]